MSVRLRALSGQHSECLVEERCSSTPRQARASRLVREIPLRRTGGRQRLAPSLRPARGRSPAPFETLACPRCCRSECHRPCESSQFSGMPHSILRSCSPKASPISQLAAFAGRPRPSHGLERAVAFRSCSSMNGNQLELSLKGQALFTGGCRSGVRPERPILSGRKGAMCRSSSQMETRPHMRRPSDGVSTQWVIWTCGTTS